MEEYEAELENKLNYLDKNKPCKKGIKHTTISNHNANLIREFIEKNKDLPTPPQNHRLLSQVCRLKSICIMLKDKPLDKIDLDSIKQLNRTMNEKKMSSAGDYRKTLRRFLKLKDKKKYFDLLESEYFRESRNAQEKPLVEPEKFWSPEEIERYLAQSKQHSLRQAAFGAIWISSAARPKEILNIKKKDIFLKDENTLVYRIDGTKTAKSKRSIVIKGSAAKANWGYIKPYLETLTDEEVLFPIGWQGAKKQHCIICELARIPKEKAWNLYIMRKQGLTRLYGNPKLGYAQACSQAGHAPGSKAMKHYVGFTEEQLIEEQPYEIALKSCPNPNCSFDNEPHHNYCVKCSAPLDREVYGALITKTAEDLVNTKLEAFKLQFEAHNWKLSSTLK